MNTAGPKPVHGANMGSMQARNTSSSVRGAITWFRSQRMSVRQRAQERGAREAIQDNELLNRETLEPQGPLPHKFFLVNLRLGINTPENR